MISRRAFVASIALAGTFVSAPALSQQASTDAIEITDGFVRATAGKALAGAAFLTITSKGGADRLVAFATPVCNRPELHTHINDDGIMRMRQVEAIDVPAGGTTMLKPGGLHLMMIDLNTQLVEGETVDFTLTFENAGEVDVTLPVKGIGAMN